VIAVPFQPHPQLREQALMLAFGPSLISEPFHPDRDGFVAV
jgi:hypothetical protein